MEIVEWSFASKACMGRVKADRRVGVEYSRWRFHSFVLHDRGLLSHEFS